MNYQQRPNPGLHGRRGAPKNPLDAIWEEHWRRVAEGQAQFLVAREAKALAKWADQNLPQFVMKKTGTAKPFNQTTIRNRLMARHGVQTANGYTLKIIERYLDQHLAEKALGAWRLELLQESGANQL